MMMMATISENIVYRLSCDALHRPFQFRPQTKTPAFVIDYPANSVYLKVRVQRTANKLYLHTRKRGGDVNFKCNRSTEWEHTLDTRQFDDLYITVFTTWRPTEEQVTAQSWAGVLILPPLVLARVPAAQADGFRLAAFAGAASNATAALRIVRGDAERDVRFELLSPAGITFESDRLCVRVETPNCRTDWLQMSQTYAVCDRAEALLNAPSLETVYVVRSSHAMEVHDIGVNPVWLQDNYADRLLRKYAIFAPESELEVPATPAKKLTAAEDTRDLTLLVGLSEQPFRVHRALLVSQSPVIETMLKPEWRLVGQCGSEPDQSLNLCHDFAEGWHSVIRFWYTGVMRHEYAVDAMRVAHKYCMDDVFAACEYAIIASADFDYADDVADLRNVAALYKCRRLLKLINHLPDDADAVERARNRMLSKLNDNRWFQHMRRTFSALLESADRTGDWRVKLGGRMFGMHSFVVDLVAPKMRTILQEGQRLLQHDEIELLLRHFYVGASYNMFVEEKPSGVRFDHFLQMVEQLDLPMLVVDMEAYAISEQMLFGDSTVSEGNERVQQFKNEVVSFDPSMLTVHAQFSSNQKKKVPMRKKNWVKIYGK